MKLPFEERKREILTKQKAKTDEKIGCYPDKRSVEELIDYGVVNIDKPSGPTSHQASAYVQKILNINKAGHSGTLDPRVTGVLPIALGRATRIVQTLLPAGKEYIAVMHLHKEVSEEHIRKNVEKFIGKIKQLPPIKSSVKRQLRERTVYYFDILEIEKQDVLFKVGCEAGTYIRKLVFDFGKSLGIGAHMADLRRTKAGSFDESSLVTLQNLTDAYHYWKEEGNEKYIRHCIQPIENAVSHLPKVWVLDSAVDTLCHGANLNNPGIAKVNDPIEKEQVVAVMTLKDELVGIGRAFCHSAEMMQEKGLAVKVNKVFMLPGVYKV